MHFHHMAPSIIDDIIDSEAWWVWVNVVMKARQLQKDEIYKSV